MLLIVDLNKEGLKMFSHSAVKKVREDSGFSQEQLIGELAKTGITVSRPTLSGWENGDSVPDANALAGLAIVFRKPVKFFFVS